MGGNMRHLKVNNPIFGLVFAGMASMFSGAGNATVMGAGEIDFNITTDGSPSFSYIYGDRMYGSVRDYVAPGPLTMQTTYLDAGTLQNETTLLGTTLRGAFDQATGGSNFSYEVNSSTPGAGNFSSAAVDLYGRGTFTGTLSSFSYSYLYGATKDNPTDTAQFIIQMELAYFDPGIGTFGGWIKVYSDYGTANFAPDLVPEDNYRTRWVRETDTSNLNVGLEGVYDFGDYSRYGVKTWQFRYDLQSVGVDSFGDSAPSNVPEPASLALVGIGLAGLSVVRRRILQKAS
jgi:hypothetical protein